MSDFYHNVKMKIFRGTNICYQNGLSTLHYKVSKDEHNSEKKVMIGTSRQYMS